MNAALSESFQMVNQMGAAPGAKWGDLVTGIYTQGGDLAMIAPHGIIAFAACCFYPIRFIIKNWMNDPTVGVREGDGFIHNDARYGGIHNTGLCGRGRLRRSLSGRRALLGGSRLGRVLGRCLGLWRGLR